METDKNNQSAEKNYRQLSGAFQRRDWDLIEELKNLPADIDVTELSQDILDKLEDLYGRIGEAYEKEVRGI